MEMPHRIGFDTTPPPSPAWDRHLEPEVRAEVATTNPMQPIVDVMRLQPARNIILTGIQSDPGVIVGRDCGDEDGRYNRA